VTRRLGFLLLATLIVAIVAVNGWALVRAFSDGDRHPFTHI
jgi:hypothetical protein